jgi:Holliday junction resolvasome RuvABC ATP-dependent DNA helicase subunit
MNNQQMKGVEIKKILYHYLEDYARDLKSYDSSRYILIILNSSLAIAETTKWQDFTKPLSVNFEISGTLNEIVEVYLPEELVKNFDEIPVYFQKGLIFFLYLIAPVDNRGKENPGFPPTGHTP